MASSATFGEIFGQSRPSARGVRPREERPPEPTQNFLRSGEMWLTFLLVAFSQFAVVGSLEEANWVSWMPSLLSAGGLGLVTGWLLSHARIRQLWLHIAGLAIGLTTAIGMVLHTMRLTDPLLGAGLQRRWTELWERMGDWWAALVSDNISNDQLPFVVLLVFMVWGMAYVSAFGVFRWRNAWAALVPGGMLLLTNISYLPGKPSFNLILFLFTAILIVSRMQFVRSMRDWRSRRIARPEYLSLEVLHVGAWIGLGLIILAWVIPTANNFGPVATFWLNVTEPVAERIDRFGRLFVGIGSKKDLAVHRFGDVLPLRGEIKLSDDLLFSIVADGEGTVRGATYDEYTPSGWRVSSADTEPLFGTSLASAQFGTPETRAQLQEARVIEVRQEAGVNPRRLLSAGEPIAANVEAQLLVGDSPDDVIGLVPDDRLRTGKVYVSIGAVSAASVDTLRTAGQEYPSFITERYLQLPASLPPEVAELAAQVTAGANDPFQAASLVESHLRRNYAFTLEIPDPPPNSDVVSWFLFEERQGYFDHFATTMAVMLRTQGIPSRVAVGFALDDTDLNRATKAYEITERRAWAWPEVYFPGLGWAEFNPTPGRPVVQRPGIDPATLAALGIDGFDDLLLDDELLEDELFDVAGLDSRIGGNLAEFGAPGSGIGTLIARGVTIVVFLAAMLVVAALAFRFAWEYRFREMTPPMRRWAKVQRLANWAGVGGRTTHTPYEAMDALASVFGRDVEQERPAAQALARSYTRERYAFAEHEESDEERDDLDAQYRIVRRRLVPLIIGRVWPFGEGVAEPSAIEQTDWARPGRA
jgi:transglutaminase-like putative cysteine protease